MPHILITPLAETSPYSQVQPAVEEESVKHLIKYCSVEVASSGIWWRRLCYVKKNLYLKQRYNLLHRKTIYLLRSFRQYHNNKQNNLCHIEVWYSLLNTYTNPYLGTEPSSITSARPILSNHHCTPSKLLLTNLLCNISSDCFPFREEDRQKFAVSHITFQ